MRKGTLKIAICVEDKEPHSTNYVSEHRAVFHLKHLKAKSKTIPVTGPIGL
jgi:hypothetical protein